MKINFNRTRNASASVIKNRMKKINEAQKDLVKNMSKLSVNTAATEAIETTTVKIKKEAVGERE